MVRDLETTRSYPIAGSLRVGEKNGNRPTSLNYFTVHEDTHTTDDVTKHFNSILGEKPKEIVIRFLSDEPFETDYLRYAKSGLQCKGDGEKANYLDKSKNEWCECECSKDCKYRGSDCKLTGRLHFIIKNINIGGLWRFQTRSYNTITNILQTINFLKCMNVDIKEKDFKLIIEEKTSSLGGETRKYTTVNLKVIVNKDELIKKRVDEKTVVEDEKEVINENKLLESNQENATSPNVDEFEKCLSLVEVHDLNIKDNIFKEAVFCNMKDETENLIIHPSILEEVSAWEIGSAIIPTKILEKNGFKTLTEYKDLGILKKKKAE